jgi:hypothetical protein
MAECPGCGEEVAVDSAGNMAEHGSPRCIGSGVNADTLYEELQRW